MTPSEKPASEIVCLLDDDPAVLKSISRLLASDGIAVRAFDKPKVFLAYVQMNRVPLVILDIWMEELNGFDVQAQVSVLSPDTHVIIMTGRENPRAEATALEAGAIAFFTKPFDDEEFLAAVRDALAQAKN